MKMTSSEVRHAVVEYPHWSKVSSPIFPPITPAAPRVVEEKPEEEKSFWQGVKGWFKK